MPIVAAEEPDIASFQVTPNLWVLGTSHPQVNVLSQQRRAFEIVRWMHEDAVRNRLPGDERTLLVVGAGFGGLTAAVAAAHIGWTVTILEKLSAPLQLQKGCHTRWLYPYIREWPNASGHAVWSGLPLVNWQAGTAAEVAEAIERSFQHVSGATGRICLVPDVGQIDIGHYDDDIRHIRRIRWMCEKFGDRRYTAARAIVAVGFGLETNRIKGTQPLSYWRNDSFAQTELSRSGGNRKHFVVSGTGDGGLIDAIRLRIGEFRDAKLAKLVEDLLTKPGMDLLRKIEEEAWQYPIPQDRPRDSQVPIPQDRSRDRAGGVLREGYRELFNWDETKCQAVREKLSLRTDTHVTILHEGTEWLTRLVQPLNRVLAYILSICDSEHFELRQGQSQRTDPLGGRTLLACSGGIEILADTVITRHGTQSPLEAADLNISQIDHNAFPNLRSRLQHSRPIPLGPKVDALRRYPLYWSPRPLLDGYEAAEVAKQLAGDGRRTVAPSRCVEIVHARLGGGTTVTLLSSADWFLDVEAAAQAAVSEFPTPAECVRICLDFLIERHVDGVIAIDGIDRLLIDDRSTSAALIAQEVLKLVRASPKARFLISLSHRVRHCKSDDLQSNDLQIDSRQCQHEIPDETDPAAVTQENSAFPIAVQPFVKELCTELGAQLGFRNLRGELKGELPLFRGVAEEAATPLQLLQARSKLRTPMLKHASRTVQRFGTHAQDKVLDRVGAFAGRVLELAGADDESTRRIIKECIALIHKEEDLTWWMLTEEWLRGAPDPLQVLTRLTRVALQPDASSPDPDPAAQRWALELAQELAQHDSFARSNLLSLYLTVSVYLKIKPSLEPVARALPNGGYELRNLHLRGVFFPASDLGRVRLVAIDLSGRSEIREAIEESKDLRFYGCNLADTDYRRDPDQQRPERICPATWDTVDLNDPPRPRTA